MSKEGSTCGRFMGEQLDRNIEIPGKRIPWIKYFFQFALPAFLVTTKAKAQGEIKVNPVVTTNTSCNIVVGKKNIRPMNKIIDGYITDENGKGIPFASVEISDKSGNTITDSMGKFSIEILAGTKPQSQLEISSVGYESITIDLAYLNQLESGKELIIQLKQEVIKLDEIIVNSKDISVLGGFAGGLFVKVHTSYIDSVKNWLWPDKETATIYPNPVQRGASLNVKLDLKPGAEYNLAIINSDGKLIDARRILITSKSQVENISISSMFASGTYFITISDKKKRIVHSGKVIVF